MSISTISTGQAAANQKPQQPQKAQTTDAEQNPAQAEETLWGKAVQRFSLAWLVSMFLHVGLLIVLAVITLTTLNKEEEIITLAASDVKTEEIENLFEIPLEFEEPVEDPVETLEEITEESLDESLKTSDIVPEIPSSEALVSTDFGDFSADSGLGEAIGTGKDSAKQGKSKFFQGGDLAKTIVYIVDNSNSMTGKKKGDNGLGRMETALIELSKSINSLDKSQQFYVVFYSDTAYGLFHPQTVSNYVYATPQNKQKVNAWFDTVQCAFLTNGKGAFEVARRLKPELVYLLGDGGFTDKAHQTLIKNPIKGAKMQVLGMKLSDDNAKRFAQIAKAHGGKYRDVGITADGLRILQSYGPRPKNSVRGPVWGVTLPVKKKKKKK